MKLFHCGACGRLVLFENTTCLSCNRLLAFLPDQQVMAALELGSDGLQCPASGAYGVESRPYRLCRNYSDHSVCNWAVPADDSNPFCRSCRLTRVIPDLGVQGNLQAWGRLESSKRRMLSSILTLDLPLQSKEEDPYRGLAFEFLADTYGPEGLNKILTGHADGVITLNLAEADDAERERRRHDMNEPYRTLLGHFRHEIGHYYWDILVRDSEKIDGFRRLFGDERVDYGEALGRHHRQGAPASWQSSFVSAYASSHPWEDWAETWAHYLHITDTLETALASGLSLTPDRPDMPSLCPDLPAAGHQGVSFDDLIDRWFPLTFVLNNLNRGMGLPDAYPFVLSPPAVEKLRFVHDVVGTGAMIHS